MNSSSTNLVYVDAAGWIALVNLRDALHTEAVRIYKQRLQEQYQFITASVVLLDVGNWLSPAPLRGLAIDLLHRILVNKAFTPSLVEQIRSPTHPSWTSCSIVPCSYRAGCAFALVSHAPCNTRALCRGLAMICSPCYFFSITNFIPNLRPTPL
jgi:hypothetical protein